MIKLDGRLVSIALAYFLVLLVTGCIRPGSPDVTYYSLMTMEQLGSRDIIAGLKDKQIGVGPVNIPDSLKRSQVATRQPNNKYTFSEFHRWAGTLEDDIALVLANNIGELLEVEQVAIFPWMTYFKPDYRVVVDIQRFDGYLEGEAVLEARWVITDSKGEKLLYSGKNSFTHTLKNSDYPSLISAQSQLLLDLSIEIAEKTASFND